MSNPDDKPPGSQPQDGQDDDKGSWTIPALLLIALVLFAWAILQAATDLAREPRLVISGALALDLIITVVVASWGDRLCRFAALVPVAVAPAAPFAMAAYGYAFWQGVSAGVLLLTLGVAAYLWVCYDPPKGGVK